MHAVQAKHSLSVMGPIKVKAFHQLNLLLKEPKLYGSVGVNRPQMLLLAMALIMISKLDYFKCICFSSGLKVLRTPSGVPGLV